MCKAEDGEGETQYNAVSRFVEEIPAELLDQKVPSLKKWNFVDYDEGSEEKLRFRAKPLVWIRRNAGMPAAISGETLL